MVGCRCWWLPRNNERQILQQVTLQHWSSRQPLQLGLRTLFEFDTSKCSLLVRHSCKAFPSRDCLHSEILMLDVDESHDF